MLGYTIGFIARGRELLMLNRKRAPMKGLWHGVGGKLLPGENPEQGMAREIREETGIEAEPEDLRFAGILLWEFGPVKREGMYVFVMRLPNRFKYPTPAATDEGLLQWLPLDWLCNPDNHGVAEHIRRLLPVILHEEEPHEFRVTLAGNTLVELEALPLYTQTAAE